MAIHAAMIDRLDREIGRVLDQIRAMDALENTLILFLSDNGASAEIMVRDDGHDPTAPAGSAATHLCLGPGWSTVANTPVSPAQDLGARGGHRDAPDRPLAARDRRAGRASPRPGPRDRPGADDPRGGRGPRARERGWTARLRAPPGASLVPSFARDDTVHHADLWWEHEGNRAIRVGDWKLVAARGPALGTLRPWRATGPKRATCPGSIRRRLGNWPSSGRPAATSSSRWLGITRIGRLKRPRKPDEISVRCRRFQRRAAGRVFPRRLAPIVFLTRVWSGRSDRRPPLDRGGENAATEVARCHFDLLEKPTRDRGGLTRSLLP